MVYSAATLSPYRLIALSPYHLTTLSLLYSFLFRYELDDDSLYISSVGNYTYKKLVNFFLSFSYSSDSLSECLSVPDSLYPHPEGIWERVGKVTRQERKEIKITYKKHRFILFFPLWIEHKLRELRVALQSAITKLFFSS